ncbi:MAG: YbaB/EbfC family nucleoid-associated protein [Clostridia bacterium]|nr:YbaB/EbfC family nucleoid-associated protein [Clostridia bacterium]
MKVRLPKNNSFGMNNMQDLVKKAQKAQEEMEKSQAELEEKEYSASSGGEAVKVVINGKMEITKLEIKPEIVDPEDVEMLSDMIIAAVNESIKKASADKDEAMQKISGQMNLPGLF